MEISVSLQGLKPILFHNVQLADLEYPLTKQIKALTSKKTRTDADNDQIAKLEFLGGIYYDDDIGVHVPAWNLIRCFNEGAKQTREGRSILRAVVAKDEKIPLIYPGPRTLAELWADETYRYRTTVGIGQSKISRTRPMFPIWGLKFKLELATEIMNPENLAEIIHLTGKIEGLCDGRNIGYGRFSAEVDYDTSSDT